MDFYSKTKKALEAFPRDSMQDFMMYTSVIEVHCVECGSECHYDLCFQPPTPQLVDNFISLPFYCPHCNKSHVVVLAMLTMARPLTDVDDSLEELDA
jgi:hypothetical protein